VADLASLPDTARETLQWLALHESAHAVAAVILGFTLDRVRVVVCEQRLIDTVVMWPEGATDSDANAVRPECGDSGRMQRATMVALAGREAQRRKYPDYGASGFDRHDLEMAMAHLGLPPQTAAALECVLAPQTEQTRRLLADEHTWRGVEGFAAWLIVRADVRLEPSFVASTDVTGADAVPAIRSIGILPGSWRLSDPETQTPPQQPKP